MKHINKIITLDRHITAWSICIAIIIISLTACRQASNTEEQAEEPKIKTGIERFESEIEAFEAQKLPPELRKGAILFTGSSSIRMWDSLAAHFAPLPVLNRGFGGSTVKEVNHYMKRIIFPHKPSIIVLYAGENDITEGKRPTKVLVDFLEFERRVHSRLPNTPIVYLSMKPSLDREHLWKEFQRGNGLIRNAAPQIKNTIYVDISETMLDGPEAIRTDIFIEDGLHMNAKGYADWVEVLKPVLDSLYAQK